MNLILYQVIENHFWLKKNEILTQIDGWINEMDASPDIRRSSRVIPHNVVALKVRQIDLLAVIYCLRISQCGFRLI